MGDPLSVITSIITLIQAAKDAYDKVQDATHLPQAFAKIHGRTTLVTITFDEIRQKYRKSTDEHKIRGTLEECERDAKDVQKIYEVVCDAASSDWLRRYRGYVSNLVRDRKTKVEDLWESLLQGLQVLQSYHLFKNVSTVEDVAAAIKEIQEVEDSLPEDGANFNAPVGLAHTGSGANNASVWQTNNYAPSTQFQGGTHHHAPPEREETPPTPDTNMLIRRDVDHVERKTYMDRLRAKLSAPAARVALVGFGGIGKSQLAIEYAYRLREASPDTWVLWFYAANAARFEQSVRDVAELVKIRGRQQAKADIFKLMLAWLRDKRKGRWLVVLDSADDADFLLEPPSTNTEMQWKRRIDYFPVCDHGVILITSRSLREATKLVRYSDVITVDIMDQSGAITMLEKKLRTQTEKTEIQDLAKALDGIPLAITVAAGYITQRGHMCSVNRYLKKLRKRETSILDEEFVDHQRDHDAQKPILLTWQISFEHIYGTRRSAAELLSSMSFCDRQAIPDILIRTEKSRNVGEAGSKHDKQDRNRRSDEITSHEDHASGSEVSDDSSRDDNESSDDDDDDIDSFIQDIATLKGYSFVSATADPAVFEMHRLVQLATQQWLLSKGQLEEGKVQHIDKLYNIFPVVNYENWSACKVLFPHAYSATSLRFDDPLSTRKWTTVILRAAEYAITQGDYTSSEQLAARSMKTQAKILGADDLFTMDSASVLAIAKKRAGKFTEAETLEAKIKDVRTKALGEEHPATLIAMANLAITYGEQGRLKEGEALELKIMEARARSLGEDHPRTLSAMANLAVTYHNLGRWNEACAMEERVLKSRSKLLGEEHPRVLTDMANLAASYYNQNRWREAEELQTKVLEANSTVLGEEHPHTLATMNSLAGTYLEQGRWEEGEKLQTKALHACSRRQGEDHPDTLLIMSGLVVTYRYAARWKEAEEMQTRVIEARLKVLGEDHPETIKALNNLAALYWSQKLWGKAEDLQMKVLAANSKILGKEHPDTVLAMTNLTATYCSQARLEEAEELGLIAFEISSKVIGKELDLTIVTMANLASIYSAQGRVDEAESLEFQASEIASRVLGKEHPSTLTAMNNLAFTYNHQGRISEARELLTKVVEGRSRTLGEGHPDTQQAIANRNLLQ